MLIFLKASSSNNNIDFSRGTQFIGMFSACMVFLTCKLLDLGCI